MYMKNLILISLLVLTAACGREVPNYSGSWGTPSSVPVTAADTAQANGCPSYDAKYTDPCGDCKVVAGSWGSHSCVPEE